MLQLYGLPQCLGLSLANRQIVGDVNAAHGQTATKDLAVFNHNQAGGAGANVHNERAGLFCCSDSTALQPLGTANRAVINCYLCF